MSMRSIRPAVGIALACFVVLANASPALAERDCLRVVAGIDLQTATIPELNRAMSDGVISSQGLVRAYRRRVDAYDERVGAVLRLNPHAAARARQLDSERRRGRVRSVLHGVPIMLKDNIGTRSLTTTAGSVALRRNLPRRNATIVSRLLAAGAVVLGKENMAEFADASSGRGREGSSTLGGYVVNPYNGGSPASSSSGSAVSQAMAFAAASVGTDTSGSVIFPARENMVVGFRATTGLVPRAGLIPFLPSRDTAGPLTRSVTDAAVILDVLTGRSRYASALDRGDLTGLRIGVRSHVLDDQATDQQRQTIAVMRAAGAELVDIGRASIDYGRTDPREFRLALGRYLRTESRRGLGLRSLRDVIRAKARMGYADSLLREHDRPTNLPERKLRRRNTQSWRQARQRWQHIFAAHDVDVMAFVSGEEGARSGLPILTVPTGMGRVDGNVAPTGAVILGKPGQDGQLLGVGRALEAQLPARPTPFEVGTTPMRAVRDCSGSTG